MVKKRAFVTHFRTLTRCGVSVRVKTVPIRQRQVPDVFRRTSRLLDILRASTSSRRKVPPPPTDSDDSLSEFSRDDPAGDRACRAYQHRRSGTSPCIPGDCTFYHAPRPGSRRVRIRPNPGRSGWWHHWRLAFEDRERNQSTPSSFHSGWNESVTCADSRRTERSPHLQAGLRPAVLVMWLVGAQPPLAVVPSTIQAARQEPALPPPDVPSAPGCKPPAEGVRADSTPRPSSIVTTPTRPIGTSGGQLIAPYKTSARALTRRLSSFGEA